MMPMKLYEVEFVRTAYVTYVVEALDESHAEDEALKLLERDGRADNGDANWDVSYIEEYTP
jgi:hypothetical protein